VTATEQRWRIAFEKWWRSADESGLLSSSDYANARLAWETAIREAVAAERERCAKIAEDMDIEVVQIEDTEATREWDAAPVWVDSVDATREAIARRIRGEES